MHKDFITLEGIQNYVKSKGENGGPLSLNCNVTSRRLPSRIHLDAGGGKLLMIMICMCALFIAALRDEPVRKTCVKLETVIG